MSRLRATYATYAHLFRMLLLGYDPDTLEARIAERLRTAQFAAATRHSTLMLLGNLVNAFVIVIVAASGAHFWAAIAWAGILAIFFSPLAFKRKPALVRSRPRGVSHRKILRLTRNTAALAVIWGGAPMLMMSAGPREQFIIALLTAGMLAGGAFGMSSLPIAVVAYELPIGGGFLLGLALTPTPVHYMAAPLTIAYISVLIGVAISHGRSFADSVIAQTRAELAARHDPLTGLPNRAAFDAALTASFARFDRYGDRFGLLCIDLDDFKAVNDRLGHQAGDELLRQAADRLRDAVDARGSTARLGGDEFAVLARLSTEGRDANALAADIASRFDVAFVLEAGSILCRASVGLAIAPDDGFDAKSLVAHADKELYRAKRELKPTTPGPTDRAGDQVQRRRELTREMRASLGRGEFFLQYQPVQSLRNGRVEGFEALVRWRHPTLGLIAPLEFIDIAEKNGMIHELGEWILDAALREAALWPDNVRIAVNVSGEQLCDVAFEAIFAGAIVASGVDPQRVQIEVTESVSLAAVGQAEAALRRLDERGVEIVLDDFGIGFSSFAMLRRLPVKRLKIDRAFVSALPFERESAAIVEAVLGIARALDFKVTAEGVETEAQLAYLKLAGVSEAQGYLIAKPLDAADARNLLARQAASRRDATAA